MKNLLPFKISALVLLFVSSSLQAQDKTAVAKRIHVVVALCDNEHQGIAPVNARIGNGNDLANNLYWGCSDGLWRFFKKAPEWKLIKSEKDLFLPSFAKAPISVNTENNVAEAPILEILTFEHQKTKAVLTAEAWRGSEIKAATIRYFSLLSQNGPESPQLVAWIGHNSLMDFVLEKDWIKRSEKPKDTIVLACKSQAYHGKLLDDLNVRPVLMTDQFMYPGSFILKSALDGWMNGESHSKVRDRAAKSYAANQKISLRSALGVFSKQPE